MGFHFPMTLLNNYERSQLEICFLFFGFWFLVFGFSGLDTMRTHDPLPFLLLRIDCLAR
ncbi:hypothetical protein GCM10007916_08670 [Psychromonas marina]|uniref:Uncharacterized protein n=1 Tax=Psychromonas marina TaxID=88364 RepID=A0ABQ6DXJ1_9GAMM|nr:hypothetical protein GCM10007916_08670 [Psychromonas marina]